jgi:hypothetical protein
MCIRDSSDTVVRWRIAREGPIRRELPIDDTVLLR